MDGQLTNQIPIKEDNFEKVKKPSFSCKLCTHSATSKNGLKIHQKNIHEKIKHHCDKCNKQFNQKSNLNDHVKTIHEGIRFPCQYCEFKAKQKIYIKEPLVLS